MSLGGASAGFLQDFANAGVGLPIGGSENAPYFVATTASELQQALEAAIAGQLTPPVPLFGPWAAVALAAILLATSLRAVRLSD